MASAMLSSLVDHKNHFQEQRARDKAEIIKTYCMGKALAAEKVNRKHYPFSMTNSELHALSQYESGKARKELRCDFATPAPPLGAKDWRA